MLLEFRDMEKLRKKWIWIKSKLPTKKSSNQGKLDLPAVLSQNGLICHQETLQIYNKNGEQISLDMKMNHAALLHHYGDPLRQQKNFQFQKIYLKKFEASN